MATERIQIIVSSRGTVTVKREIDAIGDSAKKTNDGVGLLKGALGALTAAFSVAAIVKYADAGIRLQNSLRQTGLAGLELAAAQDKIYATALRNGQEAEGLGVVYQKLSTVQKELGLNGEGIMTTLDGIAAAMKLSTASTQAQAGSLQQLSQLLGGSTVQAQEFNSLIDGAFPIVQAAARGIDGMNGSVAKLTQAIKAGGFSTKVFFDGLQKGLVDTKALAETLPLTIGQSLTNLGTAFQMLLVDVNSTTSVFTLLAGTIDFVANNLNLILTLLTPVALAFAYLAGAAAIGAVVNAFTSFVAVVKTIIPLIATLNALLYLNPFIAMGAALVALIAAVVYFRNELGWTDERLAALGATAVLAWNYVVDGAKRAYEFISPLIDLVGTFISKLREALGLQSSLSAEAAKPAAAKGGGAMNGKGFDAAVDVFRSSSVDWAKTNEDSKKAHKKLYGASEEFGKSATGFGTSSTKMGTAADSLSAAGARLDAAGYAIDEGGNRLIDTATGLNIIGDKLGASGDNLTGSSTNLNGSASNLNSAADAIQSASNGLYDATAAFKAAAAIAKASNERVMAAANEAARARTPAPGRAPFRSEELGLGNTLDSAPSNRGRQADAEARGAANNAAAEAARIASKEKALARREDSRSSSTVVSAGEAPRLQIQNFTDPRGMIDVVDTSEGQRAIVNVISNNKEEIQRLLGSG